MLSDTRHRLSAAVFRPRIMSSNGSGSQDRTVLGSPRRPPSRCCRNRRNNRTGRLTSAHSSRSVGESRSRSCHRSPVNFNWQVIVSIQVIISPQWANTLQRQSKRKRRFGDQPWEGLYRNGSGKCRALNEFTTAPLARRGLTREPKPPSRARIYVSRPLIHRKQVNDERPFQ